MNHMSKMNGFRDIKLFPFTLCTGAHLPCEVRVALRARNFDYMGNYLDLLYSQIHLILLFNFKVKIFL